MNSRSTELRNRERLVFRVSFGIAVVLHVAALGYIAWSPAAPEWRAGTDTVRLEVDAWTGTRVDVFFGPPKILLADGAIAEEAEGRILEAVRMLQMPPTCFGREIVPRAPSSGQIRLTVNSAGRIDAAAVDQSTGDRCWDLVARRVAGDLWYRWLPSERFPAPLELLQPITVGLSQY